MSRFTDDLMENLIEEVLPRLPENTKFKGYRDSRFRFVQRDDNGETYLHTIHSTPLEATRTGIVPANAVVQRIVADPSSAHEVQWTSRLGLFGAPDGLYLTFTNCNELLEPLISYGQVRGGVYRRMFGTNGVCTTGYYSLWNKKVKGVSISNGSVHLDINPNAAVRYLFEMPRDKAGPEMDISEVATRINKHLHKKGWFHHLSPSPEYYNQDRWSYDAHEGTWTFQ